MDRKPERRLGWEVARDLSKARRPPSGACRRNGGMVRAALGGLIVFFVIYPLSCWLAAHTLRLDDPRVTVAEGCSARPSGTGASSSWRYSSSSWTPPRAWAWHRRHGFAPQIVPVVMIQQGGGPGRRLPAPGVPECRVATATDERDRAPVVDHLALGSRGGGHLHHRGLQGLPGSRTCGSSSMPRSCCSGWAWSRCSRPGASGTTGR